jgi:hypothetical protein
LLSKSAEREQGTELRRRPSPTLLPRETRDEAHVPLVVRGFHSCGGGGQGRSGPSDERGGRRALRAGVGLGGGRAETAVGPTRRDLACRWVRAGGAARGDVSCRDEEAARPSLVWAAIIVGMGPTHWLRFLTNQRFKAGQHPDFLNPLHGTEARAPLRLAIRPPARPQRYVFSQPPFD